MILIVGIIDGNLTDFVKIFHQKVFTIINLSTLSTSYEKNFFNFRSLKCL